VNEDGALFDSGFDGGRAFSVSPAGGVSLESALRDFGPAAIDDLIPRLRSLASTLDAAHASGAVHGALHPGNIFVTDQTTTIVAAGANRTRDRAIEPYAAPELAGGAAPTPASDQFALAAITFEWMFGRPITGPAVRPIEVRLMPGVDRAQLSRAFTRALAPEPSNRFPSCREFCETLAGAVVPELPLAAAAADDADDPVGPFLPEDPPLNIEDGRNIDDVKIVAEETNLTAAAPDLDSIAPPLAAHEREAESEIESEHEPKHESEPLPVAAWTPATDRAAPRDTAQRFSATALILATLVGALFGFAAGYMARPRALQGDYAAARPANTSAAAETAADITTATRGATPIDAGDAATSKTPRRSQAASAGQASDVGRLLVRSTPSGAAVTVDGVAKGVTPVALRELPIGTRRVVVARRGYLPETRTVQISKERPSRTLEVRLSPEAAPPPRPSTPASLGRPAAATGSLEVDSRPSGASVSLNGQPRGRTPLTITDLQPGEYRVLLTRSGYHNFVTTVRVVAGERVRAAASLTAVEQE